MAILSRRGTEDRNLKLSKRPGVRKPGGRIRVDEQHQGDAGIGARRRGSADPPALISRIGQHTEDLDAARNELRVRPAAAVRRGDLDAIPRRDRSSRNIAGDVTARRPSGTSAAIGPTCGSDNRERVMTSPASMSAVSTLPLTDAPSRIAPGGTNASRDRHRPERRIRQYGPAREIARGGHDRDLRSDRRVGRLHAVLVAADDDEREPAEQHGDADRGSSRRPASGDETWPQRRTGDCAHRDARHDLCRFLPLTRASHAVCPRPRAVPEMRATFEVTLAPARCDAEDARAHRRGPNRTARTPRTDMVRSDSRYSISRRGPFLCPRGRVRTRNSSRASRPTISRTDSSMRSRAHARPRRS